MCPWGGLGVLSPPGRAGGLLEASRGLVMGWGGRRVRGWVLRGGVFGWRLEQAPWGQRRRQESGSGETEAQKHFAFPINVGNPDAGPRLSGQLCTQRRWP